MVNLGTANLWNKTPEVVKNCTHEKHEQKLGHCYHQIMCTKCNYTYNINSQD